MVFNKLGRQVRELTLPFLIGVGGPEKVRELKALRALKETPYMITPDDLKYLGDLGHTEEVDNGVRFSPRGRQRFAELEDLVKSVIPQGNPAPNPTTPAAGALPVGALSGLLGGLISGRSKTDPPVPQRNMIYSPRGGAIPNAYPGPLIPKGEIKNDMPGLPDPNDPLAWQRKT